MRTSATTRRHFLGLAGRATAFGVLAPRFARAADDSTTSPAGAIVGDVTAARIGLRVLAEGGNAIDAAVSAAFAAGICSPHNSGLGGYGGHALIALAGGRKIVALDFNSVAPARTRPDLFPLDAQGRVVGNVNTFGWLAAGVPGVLAGLEHALQKYGTRSLRDALAPALDLCESGKHVRRVKEIDGSVSPDTDGVPAEQQRNRALARLLRTLSERNSAESFYRGDLAGTIADAFQRNGGLVTREDLAAFRPRELAPLAIEWNGLTLHTVPPTASGLLVLQALQALKAIDWPRLSAEDRLQAKVEALRLAWADRLATWGDPEFVPVPVEKFLSASHAAEAAARIKTALRDRRPVPLQVTPSQAGGTTHLSAADRAGNLISLTVTHGGGFGARVHVPELGLVLGHGMSRFDPRPGLPNSPGPGKRPVNNMCPTIATRQGVPVLAVGGAGGTRIPNSLLEVLLNYVGLGTSLDAALTSPRLQVDGTTQVGVSKSVSPADQATLRARGFQVSRGLGATISAVTFDPATRKTHGRAVAGA